MARFVAQPLVGAARPVGHRRQPAGRRRHHRHPRGRRRRGRRLYAPVRLVRHLGGGAGALRESRLRSAELVRAGGDAAILPHLLVVRPDLPARTVAEFVAYAKANPGKLNYGAALATPPYLLSTLFKHQAGIEVVYIPYKGSAPSVTDLLAGTTQWTIDGLTILAPLAKDGRLRPLAVASAQRWPELPEVPTLIESGYPDFSLDAWTGVVAPAGTPAAVVGRLNALINESLPATR